MIERKGMQPIDINALRRGVSLSRPRPGDQFIARLPEPVNVRSEPVLFHAEVVGLTFEDGVRRANLVVEGRYVSTAPIRELRRGRWGECIIELIETARGTIIY